MRAPKKRTDIVDTGVGLSKAVKDRLLQPCIEINSNLGEVTSLGLPIARKLAELMGGDIGCKSVVGQGSLYCSRFRHSTYRLNQRSGYGPRRQPQANPRR